MERKKQIQEATLTYRDLLSGYKEELYLSHLLKRYCKKEKSMGDDTPQIAITKIM